MRHYVFLFLLLSSLTAACTPGADHEAAAPEVVASEAAERCAFPSEPTVVYAQDNALLQYWEFEERAVWSGSVLPADSAYVQYRRFIEEADAAVAQPAQYVPEEERNQDGWQRELHNVAQAYSGEAGHLRPVQCLDALLFAYQHARYAQTEQPTEFLASVLRQNVEGRVMLRVYFGAGEALFPPKQVYGFDEVARAVAAGWEYQAMLHNHTLQQAAGEIRLGVPAPSVSDVHLLRNLVADYGLRAAWVTNGFYTLEIPAASLGHYQEPGP